MAGKVIFDLKKGNKQGEFSIYLVYRYGTKKLVYTTGEKVKVAKKIEDSDWNEKRQRLRVTRDAPQNKDINEFLDRLENATVSIFHQYRNSSTDLNNEIFKKELDKRAKNIEIKEDRITLYDFISNHISERKVKVSKGTLKINTRFLGFLKAFGKEQGHDIDFKDITVEFAYKFIDFLYSEPYEHGTNYVAKLFANLHLFMNQSYDRELHTNRAFKKDAFKIAKTPTYAIALSEPELLKMLSHDFLDNSRLAKARDLFLIGCYTGLRYSDFSRLQIEHFVKKEGREFIHITTQKTKTPVVIPLWKEAKQVLERNGGFPPESISNAKLNDYIKEVAFEVGIEGSVIFPVNKGGVTTEQTFRRCDIVKTHTARRSFATNMIDRGFTPQQIMPITGHKSEKEFLNYIRTSIVEHAMNMSKKLDQWQ